MSNGNQPKPYGITLGDSSGVGPEIFLKAYRDCKLPVPFRVFGDLAVLAYYNARLGLGIDLEAIEVHDPKLMNTTDVQPGQRTAQSGAAARQYVVDATQEALRGDIRAIVTLPINKEATQLTDPHFTGHTELIGQLCGANDVTIMWFLTS